MRKSSGLTTFIKSECANWVGDCCVGTDGDKCFNDHGACFVMIGQRCRYFEKSVLGPPNYRFHVAGYEYEKLYRAYGKMNHAYRNVEAAIKRCGDCEAQIPRGKRYCDKCLHWRRREAYRAKREKREIQCATI